MTIDLNPDYGRWDIFGVHDHAGNDLSIPFDLDIEARSLLHTWHFSPHPDILPQSARPYSGQSGWILPVQETVQMLPAGLPSLIDISKLTEADYTRVHHVARERLGLVGSVRTRVDVHEYLAEDPNIRADLTDAQRDVATEVILHRYQEFQDEPGHGAEADTEVFARVGDEVVGFLDLADPRRPEPSTTGLHRPPSVSRTD